MLEIIRHTPWGVALMIAVLCGVALIASALPEDFGMPGHGEEDDSGLGDQYPPIRKPEPVRKGLAPRRAVDDMWGRQHKKKEDGLDLVWTYLAFFAFVIEAIAFGYWFFVWRHFQ